MSVNNPSPVPKQPYTEPSGIGDAVNLRAGQTVEGAKAIGGGALNLAGRVIGDGSEKEKPEDFSGKQELQNLKKEIEKGKQQALFTRVTSWVFEEGQQPGKETINFRIWKRDPVQAHKDLELIYKQFPEFQTLITQKSITDEPTLARFLAQIFEERDEVKTQNKEALKSMSKEIGKDWIGEFFEGGSRKISEWSEEGGAGYAKIALAGLATFWIAKKVFGIGKDILEGSLGSENYWLKGASWVGLGYLGYKFLGGATPAEAKEPEGGGVDLLTWNQGEQNASKMVDKNEWEKLVKTNDGVQTFLGMVNAPVEDVLEAYKTGHVEHAINPKFLLAHVQGKGVMRDRQRAMIKDINPTRLYEVIHATVQMFESDPGRNAPENKNKTILEYLHEEYVVKAKKSGTTIEYPELLADAARIAVQKKVEEQKAKASGGKENGVEDKMSKTASVAGVRDGKTKTAI